MLIDSACAACFALFALCGAKSSARRQRTLMDEPDPARKPLFIKEIIMQMRNSLIAILLASLCGLGHAAKPRIEYKVTRVAPLISEGFAINNAGATTGDFQFSGCCAHAFVSRGDFTTSVEIVGLGDPNFTTTAGDINDRFQVVGTSGSPNGQRGFIFEHGAIRDVNVFLPAATSATGNNNAGYIVGSYQFTGAPPRGYVRAPDGAFRDIGALPFAHPFTQPEAINKRGQIVGGSGPFVADTPLVPRAFLFENGLMRNLGNLGGVASLARDINDRGQVTGYSSLRKPGVFHAFLWQDGRMVDIDGRKGVGQSEGKGINKHGHVVGTSDHLGAFVYRGKKLESLNALIDPAGGYTIQDVQGINDKGQIVGRADQAGVPFGFAVRLDPVECKDDDHDHGKDQDEDKDEDK